MYTPLQQTLLFKLDAPVPYCVIGFYLPVACVFEICLDGVKTALDPDAMLNWPKEINKQVTI